MTDTEIIPAKDADEEQLIPIYDATVKYINEQVANAETSFLNIGAYLLKCFFDDDIDKVKSQSPVKGLSIRKLALQKDINMSLPSLSRALNLAKQEVELKTVSTSKHLTASHKVLLLSVEDLTAKKNYAKMVENKELSVRGLREKLVEDGYILVRGLGAIKEGKKRNLARMGHSKLMRSFDFISGLDAEMFGDVDKPTARKTLANAEKAKESLVQLIKKLKEKIEA